MVNLKFFLDNIHNPAHNKPKRHDQTITLFLLCRSLVSRATHGCLETLAIEDLNSNVSIDKTKKWPTCRLSFYK